MSSVVSRLDRLEANLTEPDVVEVTADNWKTHPACDLSEREVWRIAQTFGARGAGWFVELAYRCGLTARGLRDTLVPDAAVFPLLEKIRLHEHLHGLGDFEEIVASRLGMLVEQFREQYASLLMLMRLEGSILSRDPAICCTCYAQTHGCSWAEVPPAIREASLAEYGRLHELWREQTAAARAALEQSRTR